MRQFDHEKIMYIVHLTLSEINFTLFVEIMHKLSRDFPAGQILMRINILQQSIFTMPLWGQNLHSKLVLSNLLLHKFGMILDNLG